MAEWVLFGIVSAIAISSAVMMVLSRNPIHSALWLVLTFICVAVYYLMVGAQFLFAVQIIVYTGAIMVLFVFVVMLLNPEREAEPLVPRAHRVASLLLSIAFLTVLARGVAKRAGLGPIPTLPGGTTLRDLGRSLYTEWLFPFELASVLLLVAMIGAIVLSKRRL